jgi:WD40 repeat protein
MSKKGHVWLHSGAYRRYKGYCSTPDGKRIVSGSDDSTIKIWDVKNSTSLATLEGHTGSLKTITITPDGQHIVSGSGDSTIKIWDVQNGTCLSTLKAFSVVTTIAVTPDGKQIVSGSVGSTIKVWELLPFYQKVSKLPIAPHTQMLKFFS